MWRRRRTTWRWSTWSWVRYGFSSSPASLERMREVIQRRHVLRQKGRGRKKKKRKKRKLPKGSSPRSLPASRGSHSEIWTSFPWFFLVFGVWVLPDESWIIELLGDDFFDVSVFYPQLGPILDTRTCVSLRVNWDGPLYLAVACSPLSVPEEYSFAVFLGDDSRIRRIQPLLGLTVDTCIVSLLTAWIFHVFLRGFTRILRVVSRPALPVVIPGSGLRKAGFTGDFAPRAISLSVLWPRCFGIIAGVDQPRQLCSGMCKAWFAGMYTSCAVSLLPFSQALMPWQYGRYGREGQFVSETVINFLVVAQRLFPLVLTFQKTK